MNNYGCSLVEKVTMINRNKNFYEKYVKRVIDIFLSLITIIFFSWLYIILAVLVRIKLGSPVLFKQPRPGKNEEIFNMYKFRTMTNDMDEKGNLLPDDVRLTSFGKWLRSTSLDELPELFNILLGDMSLIGPRPQLIRDMVFMTIQQRQRHCVTPGLSGLAQVNGRNSISWEDKINWDLLYIKNITFLGDVLIIVQTISKAFFKKEGITSKDLATAEDFGDYLLDKGSISQTQYSLGQKLAKDIIGKREYK